MVILPKAALLASKPYETGLYLFQLHISLDNSLVFYFYRRALEETEKQEDVKEEVFRYPGPRPQTKETAIVHLADSVEGACRAQEEPTPQRIEEVVRTVINNKFIDWLIT